MSKRRTPPLVKAGSREAVGVHGSSTSIVPPHCLRVHGSATAIYIASPISTFSEPWYDDRVSAVSGRYPGAKIVESRYLYRHPGEWREVWPVLLRVVDRLIFFTDSFGFVGRGVFVEVESAVANATPVEYLDRDGRFRPYGEVALVVVNDDDWASHALVSYPRESGRT